MKGQTSLQSFKKIKHELPIPYQHHGIGDFSKEQRHSSHFTKDLWFGLPPTKSFSLGTQTQGLNHATSGPLLFNLLERFLSSANASFFGQQDYAMPNDHYPICCSCTVYFRMGPNSYTYITILKPTCQSWPNQAHFLSFLFFFFFDAASSDLPRSRQPPVVRVEGG